MSEFLLPDLGEGLTEAEIVRWLVAEGDTISIDQPVVEVESAKSVVELPSPFGGVVTSLRGETGTIVHAGEVLLTVSSVDAAAPAVAPPAAVPAEPGVAVPDAAAEESGAVLIGYGTRERVRSARTGGSRFRREAASATTPTRLDPARRSPVVSPLVRRLAREHGFDATQLEGSGRDRLVLRADVEAFIRSIQQEATAAAPAASPADDLRIPLTGLRRTVSERLSRSRREIPEATVWMDVDATRLIEAKRELEAATGERFSLTALLARFVVAGLARYPVLNSSVDTEAGEIVQHGAVHLGLAAQTPRGLMVPVVHGAQAMSMRGLRDAIADVVASAATGDFPAAMLTGGTFTLNNFGALGVDGSAAIINHPEAAILGVGRMMERPWVVDGALAVRTVVELSFVFDHRVCDGGVAAGFLTYVARCIEHPIGLLGDL